MAKVLVCENIHRWQVDLSFLEQMSAPPITAGADHDNTRLDVSTFSTRHLTVGGNIGMVTGHWTQDWGGTR